MQIRDIFETRVTDRIEPVIKVGDRQDDQKLAGEIGSYVVTPTLEKYLEDFLEHYTDTFLQQTEEIGVWISGYFGSGKSHLAKIMALLVENRDLEGTPACKRFESRVSLSSSRRESILRSLSRIPNCQTRVLGFNLNTVADSKNRPLPQLLLSQFYQSKGYGANFLYARVIEAELDKRGKLNELHKVVEGLTKKPWAEIQNNLNFYSRPLYQAASEVVPDVFHSSEEVQQALKNAESGEHYNAQFFIRTVLDDLRMTEKKDGKSCRLVLVLDESGQWIEDDKHRLSQLQALIEEAAAVGQGKIWVFVTTHEDMGSIYKNARALQGDMKKIEGRFRHKFNLTTENIELVLEDRIFKKNIAGKAAWGNSRTRPRSCQIARKNGFKNYIHSFPTRFIWCRRLSKACAVPVGAASSFRVQRARCWPFHKTFSPLVDANILMLKSVKWFRSTRFITIWRLAKSARMSGVN